MRHISFFVVFATVCAALSAATAQAQFPGRHHYGSYGGYGYDDTALALYSLNNSNQANQAMANSYRAQGQQGGQQMAAMQGSIRGSMDAAGNQRMQSLSGQQQSGRDWWFQVEQQQMAQRQGPSGRYSDFMAQPVGFEPAAPSSNMPAAARDIIKWPPVLCDPRFAEQRTEIESPYRRGGAKGLGIPTDDDYRNMIQATDQMKDTLQDMDADVSAQDYRNTAAFLDQLAAEARTRLDKTAPKK